MYTCDNCGTLVAEARGRCPTCNMRLRATNVTPAAEASTLAAPVDLDVSHRCPNCGVALVDEGGKCRACRFPISPSQLGHVPGAAVVSLPERIRDSDLRRAS